VPSARGVPISPYLFLGPAHYVNHTGDRPIAITSRLEHEMPTDFFTIASAVAQCADSALSPSMIQMPDGPVLTGPGHRASRGQLQPLVLPQPSQT
jgi:hypothetical protein